MCKASRHHYSGKCKQSSVTRAIQCCNTRSAARAEWKGFEWRGWCHKLLRCAVPSEKSGLIRWVADFRVCRPFGRDVGVRCVPRRSPRTTLQGRRHASARLLKSSARWRANPTRTSPMGMTRLFFLSSRGQKFIGEWCQALNFMTASLLLSCSRL